MASTWAPKLCAVASLLLASLASAEAPPGRYRIDAGADVVFDTRTELTWQRTVPNTSRTFAEARNYCANLVLAERGDWRLPTLHELQSIVDWTRSNPALDPTAFPADATSNSGSWTSSIDRDDTEHVSATAYVVSMARGTASRDFTTSQPVSNRNPAVRRYLSRCVR